MNWEALLGGLESNSMNLDRSLFEKDFDRIIFSHPFRKLQDKTQVHPLPEQDFVHNRLTHSLEVSSVGRSLGRSVGSQILKRHPSLKTHFTASDFGVITASAALAHDIGNPPFGHSGEDAISDYFLSNRQLLESEFKEQEWFDLVNFEGNAQGFRLLNKSGYQGLKLTAPTLAAFTKYPRPSKVEDQFKPRRSQKKYGYYISEGDVFKTLATDLGLEALSENQWVRHPLAFLVEAADDICYHIIDLEDGCNLGLVSHEQTVALYAEVIGKRFNREKLNAIKSKPEQIGLLRALAIGELIAQCETLFLDNEQNILSGKYDISLTDAILAEPALLEIKKVSIDKIYRSRNVVEIEAAGFNVLNGLLETFVPAVLSLGQMNKRQSVAFRLLPQDLKEELKTSTNTYLALRALLDYISGLTDSNAMSLYRKLMGISLPGMR
ncbi:dGTP triphosphohydrolase [Roseivirga sp.]|uniref:dGTP triphosphohydrolase n=1 Tax=Roseivirga sp. TaxID=1964215 RepID=UPI003B8DD23E